MKNAIYIEFDGINLGTEDSYANHARNILTLINKNITKSVDVGNIQNDDLWGDFGWFGTLAKKAAKKNRIFKKKGRPARPEIHRKGRYHYHDGNHNNPRKPNIHYSF